jgi:hypothetical protein
MMQPLPVALDMDDNPLLIFHTSSKTRKAAELAKDPRCALAFVDSNKMTCVTFTGKAELKSPLLDCLHHPQHHEPHAILCFVTCTGKAERLSEAGEKALIQSWPLFPPLSYSYRGEGSLENDFTAWRLRADKIQVECPALGLSTAGRSDWQSPTLKACCPGGWELVVAPGRQGEGGTSSESQADAGAKEKAQEKAPETEVSVENAPLPPAEVKWRFKLPFLGK